MSSNAVEAYKDMAGNCGHRRTDGVHVSTVASSTLALSFTSRRRPRFRGFSLLLASSGLPLGRTHMDSTVVTEGLKEAIVHYEGVRMQASNEGLESLVGTDWQSRSRMMSCSAAGMAGL